MDPKPKRDYGLDLLRIYACFSLLPFHYCIYGIRHEQAMLNYIDTFIKSLSEYHIPLFLMISGALFLSREKLDIKRIYKHNILHLFLVYLFWSAIYAIFDVFINIQNVTDLKSLVTWVIMDIRDSHYHLWYLPMIIVIYILFPIFHAAFGNARNFHVLKYTVAIFLVFGVIIKTLMLIPVKYDTYSVLLNKIDVGTFASYIGFAFTGYFLYQIRMKVSSLQMRFLVVLMFLSAAVIEFVNISRVPSEGINTYLLYFPIPCFVIECTLFLLFARINPERTETKGKIITSVSECMLGTYCIHDLVMSLVEKAFGFVPDSFYILKLLLVIAISFVLSICIVMCMRKSRVLKKIAV